MFLMPFNVIKMKFELILICYVLALQLGKVVGLIWSLSIVSFHRSCHLFLYSDDAYAQHDVEAPTPPALLLPIISGKRSALSRATEYLKNQYRIGAQFDNHKPHSRYVLLKSQEMYDSLVNLYTMWFKAHWHEFNRLVETCHPTPQDTNQKATLAAQVLVSGFFHDVYVVNRLACRKLGDVGCMEHFFEDRVLMSEEYDPFLCSVLNMLRPTHIKLTHEDTLFIPLLHKNPDFLGSDINGSNPYGLENFNFNLTLFHGILVIMQDQKRVKLMEVSRTSEGRPFWLFDWQSDLFYAWFPVERNYTMEDVALAYIIGTACTPCLGPRDFDDWQNLPNNVRPERVDPYSYQRIRAVIYHGAVNVRSYQFRTHDVIVPAVAPPSLGSPDSRNTTNILENQPATQNRSAPKKRGRPPKKTKRCLLPESSQINEGSSSHVKSSMPGLVLTHEEQKLEQGEKGEDETHAQPPVPPATGTNVQNPRQPQSNTTTLSYEQIQLIDYQYHCLLVFNSDFRTRYETFKTILEYGLGD